MKWTELVTSALLCIVCIPDQAWGVTTNYTATLTDKTHASDLHVSLKATFPSGAVGRIEIVGAPMITQQPAGCGTANVSNQRSRVDIYWPDACVTNGETVKVDITYNAPAGSTVAASHQFTTALRYSLHPVLSWADFEPLAEPPSGAEEGTVALTVSGITPFSGKFVEPVVTPDAGGFKATGARYENVISQALMFTRGSEGSVSWVDDDKKTAALLNHEQRHFDLSQIFALKLIVEISAINEMGTGSTKKAARSDALNKVNAKVKSLRSSVPTALNNAQARYDEETAHGTNMTKQAEWDASIDACLMAISAAVASETWTVPPACADVC